MRAAASSCRGRFLDIGTPEDFAAAAAFVGTRE
jgi:hypothetical protein